MRSIKEVQADLTRLNEALSTAGAVEGGEPAAKSLTAQGLIQRQAELLHELQLVRGEAPIEVRFLGGVGMVGSSVSAALLANTLSHLQLAVTSAAAALIHGERARFGPFRRDVAAASTMRVTGFQEGSFVVTLDGPLYRGAQLTIDNRLEAPPFDEALHRVLNVIEALQLDQAMSADEAVADLDSKRAVHHVRDLAQSIAERDTAVAIVERGPFSREGPREVGIRLGGAKRIVDGLDSTRQTTQVAWLQGRLTGVRWTRATFDLELPNGEILSGRVVADLRARVQERFDREVDAEVSTTTTEGRGGTRRTHTLIGLGE